MKGFKYVVTVKGHSAFPIDMLRYDRCTPHRESDSHIIAATLAQDGEVNTSVEVVKFTREPHWEPTRGRWESRLWKVTDVTRESIDTAIL